MDGLSCSDSGAGILDWCKSESQIWLNLHLRFGDANPSMDTSVGIRLKILNNVKYNKNNNNNSNLGFDFPTYSK